MPKVISNDAREILLKVKEFFKEEKLNDGPIIPFERVNDRVAAATGISLRTLARVTNEGKIAEASLSKINSTGKNRKTRKDKVVKDNSEN